MITEPPRLTIHIFGAGKGESIVLRLPDGCWGVVDCLASSSDDPGTNPVLRFLREQGVTELEFLCLTHPHDDHYKGMSHLLEAFPVRCFWPFNGLGVEQLLQLAEYLEAEASGIGRAEEIASAQELVKIFRFVNEKRRGQRPRLLQKLPTVATPLYPVPHAASSNFQIIGLAPSGNQAARYKERLLRCFDGQGRIRGRLPHSHHNVISSALLISYGRTRVILGGDVEREGWLDTMREMGKDSLAADAVKVSHHGSSNGYCDGLWESFAKEKKPVGVVTAYASQSLPRMEALDHISLHTEKLLVTCMTAIKQEQLPRVVDANIFRSRLALMKKMGGLVDGGPHECGRCTLVFDDDGNCIESVTIPPAGLLPAAS